MNSVFQSNPFAMVWLRLAILFYGARRQFNCYLIKHLFLIIQLFENKAIYPVEPVLIFLQAL